MLALYSAALALALVAGAPWFLYQALRRQKYLGSLRERLGALPVSLNLDGEPSIWIHAVSVGEVLAARPLADELKTRYPGVPPVRLDDDERGTATGEAAPSGCRRRVLFPDRLRIHRPARAESCGRGCSS